ncbi:uncharacterized protein LOC120771889 isoform X7 [Bactrocera tryoni]|uniref:uncharacterized protein LOC120771889 isoform X7 n=1 Tax=Bactrocera tryoni TaxID=59916 RepID=UPI001A95A14E|nr:uncharacterized protein LOC120771889 isoform X7 [Bactrocera tryoni]
MRICAVKHVWLSIGRKPQYSRYNFGNFIFCSSRVVAFCADFCIFKEAFREDGPTNTISQSARCGDINYTHSTGQLSGNTSATPQRLSTAANVSTLPNGNKRAQPNAYADANAKRPTANAGHATLSTSGACSELQSAQL